MANADACVKINHIINMNRILFRALVVNSCQFTRLRSRRRPPISPGTMRKSGIQSALDSIGGLSVRSVRMKCLQKRHSMIATG